MKIWKRPSEKVQLPRKEETVCLDNQGRKMRYPKDPTRLERIAGRTLWR